MHVYGLNKKYYGKKIFPLLKELLHLILVLFVKIIISAICFMIWAITYEKNKDGVLTIRKAKRIRVLTKFKLWFYRNFCGISHFFMLDKYFESIHRRFER